MSDSFTSVSASHMQEGITDLDAAEKRQEEIISSLKQELAKSLSDWDGAAQVEYARVQQDWDQAANKMKEITGRMKVVLGGIATGYGDNEKKVAGSWS